MDKVFNSRKYSGDFDIGAPTQKRMNIMATMVGCGNEVLDVGCSDGFMSEVILKHNKRYCGIEVSDDAIKKARNKGLQIFDIDLNSDWSVMCSLAQLHPLMALTSINLIGWKSRLEMM